MLDQAVKRAVAFFDGQNLFNHAKAAFGYDYPNYCALSLAAMVCKTKNFHLQEIRFYTGIPDQRRDPSRHQFWTAKLLAMSRQGIITYSRPLRYRRKKFHIGDGIEYEGEVSEEKGIDVRLAIDVISLVRPHPIDIAIIFIQDQDLSGSSDSRMRQSSPKRHRLLLSPRRQGRIEKRNPYSASEYGFLFSDSSCVWGELASEPLTVHLLASTHASFG